MEKKSKKSGQSVRENQLRIVANDIVDLKNKVIKRNNYGTRTVYVLCSYIWLERAVGKDRAIEILLEDNTKDYLVETLANIPDIDELIDSKNDDELINRMLQLIGSYSGRYKKAKTDYDVGMAVFTIVGHDYVMEEYRERALK